ncbi:MAG TPA: sugar-transfer associated ATP-grasp domain-containing protein, partial [Thermohalobaculum sp.]|nr:sugar-transfer associated ATP-grasp domain-containing protein [Thermohalobaculum sp.]
WLPARLRFGLGILLHGGFPWATRPAAGTPPAAALIRRHGRAALLRPFPRPLRPVAALLMACIWPLQSLREARHSLGQLAPGAFPGQSRTGLLRAAWRAALRHNVPPFEYFAYRQPELPDIPPDAWIYQAEMSWLLRALARPAALRLAADKHAFARFCADAGLAGVPTLGRIGAGLDSPEPGTDRVVIKPREGANARQITLWARAGAAWRPAGSGDGEALDWPALTRTIRGTARGEMLVQPALARHRAIAHLTGCPTARINTGVRPDGATEPLTAIFATPPEGAVASNGGERRMVDLANGQLLPMGPGRAHSIFGNTHECAALDGLALPDWGRALEMVLAGHRAFPPRAVLLGWDVAFTPEGPVLIEVNMGLSLYLEQWESQTPAGTQPAADLIAAWLE